MKTVVYVADFGMLCSIRKGAYRRYLKDRANGVEKDILEYGATHLGTVTDVTDMDARRASDLLAATATPRKRRTPAPAEAAPEQA